MVLKGGFCGNCGKRLPPPETYLPKKSFWNAKKVDPNSLCIRLLIEEGHRQSFVDRGFHPHNGSLGWFCNTDCMITGLPILLERFKKPEVKTT